MGLHPVGRAAENLSLVRTTGHQTALNKLNELFVAWLQSTEWWTGGAVQYAKEIIKYLSDVTMVKQKVTQIKWRWNDNVRRIMKEARWRALNSWEHKDQLNW